MQSIFPARRPGLRPGRSTSVCVYLAILSHMILFSESPGLGVHIDDGPRGHFTLHPALYRDADLYRVLPSLQRVSRPQYLGQENLINTFRVARSTNRRFFSFSQATVELDYANLPFLLRRTLASIADRETAMAHYKRTPHSLKSYFVNLCDLSVTPLIYYL